MKKEGISDNPIVSIIIPTYNEEKDIRSTLERLVNLSYGNKEIIVVDDSTDSTPLIVKEFEKYGVRLLHREVNEGGRCGARNAGILMSRGEILIILNADVLLPDDFIEQILPHYINGADYVLVESIIANKESLFARYVDAQYHHIYDGQDWIEWTEGFSCRRNAAIGAGLFPIAPITLVAGEDGYFGGQLREKRYKKVIDRNINVYPVVPDDIRGFWRCRKEKRSSLPLYFLYGRPIGYLFIKEIVHTAYCICYMASVLPLLALSMRLQRFSSKGMKDFIPFVYCSVIEKLAVISGGWSSIYKLFKYILKGNRLNVSC